MSASETKKTGDRKDRVGVTVLIASHDLALIQHMDHRVISLSEGYLTPHVRI